MTKETLPSLPLLPGKYKIVFRLEKVGEDVPANERVLVPEHQTIVELSDEFLPLHPYKQKRYVEEVFNAAAFTVGRWLSLCFTRHMPGATAVDWHKDQQGSVGSSGSTGSSGSSGSTGTVCSSGSTGTTDVRTPAETRRTEPTPEPSTAPIWAGIVAAGLLGGSE